MKTFFFFIALSFTSLVFSQGNLQFNQVLTYAGKTSTSNPGTIIGSEYPSGSPKFTVPLNKVWKTEYLSFGGQGIFIVNSCVISEYVNSNAKPITTNIWLKSGDVLQAANVYNDSREYFISIIEFNIVP